MRSIREQIGPKAYRIGGFVHTGSHRICTIFGSIHWKMWGGPVRWKTWYATGSIHYRADPSLVETSVSNRNENAPISQTLRNQLFMMFNRLIVYIYYKRFIWSCVMVLWLVTAWVEHGGNSSVLLFLGAIFFFEKCSSRPQQQQRSRRYESWKREVFQQPTTCYIIAILAYQ